MDDKINKGSPYIDPEREALMSEISEVATFVGKARAAIADGLENKTITPDESTVLYGKVVVVRVLLERFSGSWSEEPAQKRMAVRTAVGDLKATLRKYPGLNFDFQA